MSAKRGFRYALEPLRVKGEWELAEMQVRLADCNRALDEVQVVVERLTDEVRSQFDASRTVSAPSDAMAAEVQSMRRAYLGLLSRRLESAERDRGRIEDRQREIAERTTRMQRFNDGIERHRDEQWQEHLKGLDVQAGKEADDAWLRGRHRARSNARSNA
ncbi:hypothetical protein [Aquabacterium humicola]|uniref:hypothetical protein n=1 Tax=Aquabacterium humicola TaxID=3237377 RepID=UPI002542FBFA|nr:hypothetical protein [Rubrivivax pictus]